MQRRIVHNIAEIYNLDHTRQGEWNTGWDRHFDWECQCKYCWENVGQQHYRIRGVIISSQPLSKCRKDIGHRHQELIRNVAASRK